MKRQSGLTLIELMVAMTIGLLLLAGTASLFISNKRIYREQDEMSRLQENARFALEALIRDIRMAAYAGCADNVGAVSNSLNGADDDDALISFMNGLEGSEASGNWLPSNSDVGVSLMAAGTDGIIVRYLDPVGETVSADMANTNSAVQVTGVAGLVPGDLAAVSDCESSDVFEITQVSGSQLSHATGVITGDSPGNASANFSKRYSRGAALNRFVARRYFICDADDSADYSCDEDGDGDPDDDPSVYSPALFVTENYAAPRMLVEGVEHMQILYGEDTSGDSVADTFVNAGAVTNWNNVVSVRVALLMRTVTEGQHNDPDTRTYSLLGTTIDPVDERRRRRVFSSTILVRNRL
jgi:type IV pilus assembly protein PilW